MTVIIFVTIVVILLYFYLSRNYGYWTLRKIYSLKTTPFLGNIGSLVTFRKSIGDFLMDVYREHWDKPYVGMFLVDRPCLILNDYTIVEDILFKDFNHFSQRIFSPSEHVDPLGAKSLFALQGQLWQVARTKLSQTFTPAKLKSIFKTIDIVKLNLEHHLFSVPNFCASDLSVRYMVDVISTVAFDLEGRAIIDPENDVLRKITCETFSCGYLSSLKINSVFIAPHVLNALKMRMFTDNIYKFMRAIVYKMIKEREEKNIRKNDFIGMLIEQRNNGGWDIGDGERFELEGDNMVAQIFMFMAAGHGNSSSAITFCLYELALNQDIQEKVRQEINKVVEANENNLTYDCLRDLKYLDMVINESLRKHPPFPFLDRTCTEKFTLPGTDATIDKGTYLFIPIMGMQNDDRYWPEPEKFDPERFRNPDDLKGKPFMPFSSGPRKCLGLRFALLVMKMALVTVIKNVRISTAEVDFKLEPKRFSSFPQEDFIIHVESVK